ncbi:MAG: FkbM family methyltransferase [Planctomycetes bacterium]|nr:FkbM family methyltransferase [Planctomycetota bacterium]
MSNRLSSFLKKKLFGGRRNLVSLDEPYAVMARLLKRSTVTGILDAGASNGHISERLLGWFPRATAYAFEPNPLYAQTLQDLNRRDPRIRPQFVAISDRVGREQLHFTESPGATSLLKPADRIQDVAPTGGAVKETGEVDVVTIDEWAARNGGPSIELMKFDIQGAELKALRGAEKVLRGSTLLVYAEVWFNAVYEGSPLYGEIDAFLRTQGFSLYDIYKPKYDPHGLLVYADAIFLNLAKVPLQRRCH